MAELLETTDYEKFVYIGSNRGLDPKHVADLQVDIRRKNLLHLFPLLCNDKFEIIDGQHKLAAAKGLKVPIFYIVDNDLTKADMIGINSNSKNWSLLDYINFYTTEGVPEFKVLSDFMLANPLLNPSLCINLLRSTKTGGSDTKKLRQGIVEVLGIAHANKVAEVIDEYAKFFGAAYETKFVMAVSTMLKSNEYDHDEMKRQLTYQSRSVVRCVTSLQYVEMLQDIYNYHKQKKTYFK